MAAIAEAKMKLKTSFIFIVLILSAFLVRGHPTRAMEAATSAVIQVNTSEDELNSDGDCSLREAVRAANLDRPVDQCPAGQGRDTILLPPGVYRLTLEGKGENAAATGDLDLTSEVQILGSGVNVTILDGNGVDRVFHIQETSVEISNLTIKNGWAADPGGLYGGGGVLNERGQLTLHHCVLEDNQTSNTGGGLDNAGTASVSHCTFHRNAADAGGGVFNDGSLTLDNSLLYENTAKNTGGALDNGRQATVTNTTFSANKAGKGGGIFNDENLVLLNVTFAQNSTGISNEGTMRLKNTIVAASISGDNCSGNGTNTSEGHNLDSGNSCNFNLGTDLSNTEALLDPLSDNGGPTLTHPLRMGSPAIDAGDNTDCPQNDQRGAGRPADGNQDGEKSCDIGAYEYASLPPAPLYLPLVIR